MLKLCSRIVSEHRHLESFLKIQQPNKILILETVEFVRGSAHIIRNFALCKLDVFFSRAISAAENKPSLKLNN